MLLTRINTAAGPRWAADGRLLNDRFRLDLLLAQPRDRGRELVRLMVDDQPAVGEPLAPLEAEQEVWASGVTYLRSREARMHESSSADIYDKVYDAERPELFFKALGWRVAGSGAPIRVRADASWNVPEPELTLVLNRHAEIVGYCAGNDVSSRDIEGANPLYLPQAKIYNGACALGPGIQLADPGQLTDLAVSLTIERNGQTVFRGETSTAQLKRSLQELADCLFAELEFPAGALLMTGAGIVPDDDFTLASGDRVTVQVAELTLENPVA